METKRCTSRRPMRKTCQLIHDCCAIAALVKLLRRCVNQMTSKTRQYVDTSIKFEREASQQARPPVYDIPCMLLACPTSTLPRTAVRGSNAHITCLTSDIIHRMHSAALTGRPYRSDVQYLLLSVSLTTCSRGMLCILTVSDLLGDMPA